MLVANRFDIFFFIGTFLVISSYQSRAKLETPFRVILEIRILLLRVEVLWVCAFGLVLFRLRSRLFGFDFMKKFRVCFLQTSSLIYYQMYIFRTFQFHFYELCRLSDNMRSIWVPINFLEMISSKIYIMEYLFSGAVSLMITINVLSRPIRLVCLIVCVSSFKLTYILLCKKHTIFWYIYLYYTIKCHM